MGSNTEFRACDSFISTARRSAIARPSAGPQLANTGESFALTLTPPAPPPGFGATDSRLRETMKIPRGQSAGRLALPQISFNLVLMVAMIATTIGILVVRALSSVGENPQTSAATAQQLTKRQPHVAVTEKTSADGAVRGKAAHPQPRVFMASMPLGATPSPPTLSTTAAAPRKPARGGPSAADVDESLAALAEAKRAQSF